MKILQPHKISSEILDLIYQAKEYLLIVSPYVNLKYWKQLESELVKAKKRGVRIDFFVRNEPENSASWEQIENLGIVPRLVNNLHAKFYMNECSSVISSMNLLSSSNSSSIEIGCKLDSKEEQDDLKQFVKHFLVTNEVKERPNDDDLFLSKEKFVVALQGYIGNRTQSNVRIHYKDGQFEIHASSNKFFFSVDKVKNIVVLNTILSSKEADDLTKTLGRFFKSDYFEYEIIKGGSGYYDQLGAYSNKRLSNSYLDNLRVSEKKELISEIAEFVYTVNQHKVATLNHFI